MKRSFRAALIISALFLLFLEIVRPEYSPDPVRNSMIGTVLSRTVGGVLFLLLIKESGIRVLGLPHGRTALLCTLPALAVAINNAPIIGLLTGSAVIRADGSDLFLFALQSAAVGFFEETAFRGYLFPIVLEKYRHRRVFLPTVIASAVFAAVHLVNLFLGASVGSVLLQVGYSFLIGGMCAVVLLKTRCIWLCVALHAIYNFGGTLVPTLGSGRVWDPVTVVITAVLGIAVLFIMLKILFRVSDDEAKAIYRR